MKALSALMGMSVLQAANGAVVSFNKAMARTDGHSHVSFETTSSEPLPYDLMLKAVDYSDDQVPCSGGDEDDPPEQYDGEATIALAISQCSSDDALATIENWMTTLQSGGLSLDDDEKPRKIKFVTRVIPSACTKSLPVGYTSTGSNVRKKKSGKNVKRNNRYGAKHKDGTIGKKKKNISDHKNGKYGSAMRFKHKTTAKSDKDGSTIGNGNSSAIGGDHTNDKHHNDDKQSTKTGKTDSDAAKSKNGMDDRDDTKGKQGKNGKVDDDDSKGRPVKIDKTESDSKTKQTTVENTGNDDSRGKQTNLDKSEKQIKNEKAENEDLKGKQIKKTGDDDDNIKSNQTKNGKADNDDSNGTQKKNDKTNRDDTNSKPTNPDKDDNVDAKSKKTKNDKVDYEDSKNKQYKVDKTDNANASDKRNATDISTSYGNTMVDSSINDGKARNDSSSVNTTNKGASDIYPSYSKSTADKIVGDNKSSDTKTGNNTKSNTKTDEPKIVDKGKKPNRNLLMLRDVGAQDRFNTFSKFGSVMTGLPDYTAGVSPSDSPIGIISFFDTQDEYDAITRYAVGAHVENAFYFQLCDQNADGCTSANSYNNAVPLYNNIDVFMYNPFTMSRGLHCANLADGVPVAYVDAYGKHQCFCTCPAGYELADVVSEDDTANYKMCNQVDPEVCPCTWSTHGGYTHEVTTALDVCLFQNIASNWSVPAPFPNDNYVANGRPNDHDNSNDLSSGPQIIVSSMRESPPVYNYAAVITYLQQASTDYATTHVIPDNLPEDLNSVDSQRITSSVAKYETTDSQSNQYTWIDYEQNRQQAINSLKFTSYGKYDLALVANDYSSSAECNGCLAVVDKFRPKATTVCPSNFSASTYGGEVIPAVGKDILEKASNAIKLFYDFQANATNDGCSQSNRCDAESFRVKDFFQSEYKSMDSFSDGRKCFDALTVYESFLKSEAASTNPLLVTKGYVNQDEKPVPDGQCTRCCDLSTSLRERWVDYACGSNYDLERCEGDFSQSCSINQCLNLKPDALAIASAYIKATIKQESQKVVDELSGEGYQTTTQIHRALECSKFGGQDGVCNFETAINDLFERQVKANVALGNYSDIDKFVFWRYRVRDSKSEWQTFESNKTVKFSKPDTEVTIEAWTQCGILYSGCYHVLLQVQSPVQVCDHFSKMWYQTSTKHNSGSQDSTTLCQYLQSDFAELTFDFHPKAGIPHEDGKSVRTKVSSVVCQLAYSSHSNVTIVNVQKTAPEIVSRFAVKLLDQPTTTPETHFAVTCNFVYARYGSTPFTQTCAKSFAIKDCTTTEVEPETERCLYDDCAGGVNPGPHEACGGQLISATNNMTLFSTKELQCCQACSGLATTQCEFILKVPNKSDNIKRCVPQFQPRIYDHDGYNGEGSSDFSPFSTLMSTGSNLISVGKNHAKISTVIGASAALAVVVALVVGQRRRRGVTQTPLSTFMEEASHPLLH